MSQKSSDPQAISFVSQPLKRDSVEASDAVRRPWSAFSMAPPGCFGRSLQNRQARNYIALPKRK